VVCLWVAAAAASAQAAEPSKIVVGYRSSAEETPTRVVSLPRGAGMAATLTRLRAQKDIAWAVPDYVAHATGTVIPNDPGTARAAAGWRALQWNFDGPFGVRAPEAWANAAAAGAPAGKKVIVAVLDTGVAYANRGRYRRSPDFSPYTFVQGHDFISGTPYANDHNGHGTFVAGTIAEATNNHYGLTGLAYLARIMPVRVLDAQGEGDASVIAEGVRFAVNHGAKVINLSLEFSSDVSASDIPELIGALHYAHIRGVVVVAAAGNEDSTTIPYPARAAHVIAVGATTEHGCLANYSNYGRGITLVAPGGGPDASLPGDPNCHPELPAGRDIYQMTFTDSSPQKFGFPGGYEGTSMATPHVSAVVAMMIAARVLGRKPSPKQIVARLRATARKLGGAGDRWLYGAGLLDAAAATVPLRAGIAK
jgi:serine protease